jgi:eukaryotic-like serine/threonine-protein kinase
MTSPASQSEAATADQSALEPGPSAVDARPETGRYDFLEEIARGGMGVIVRGWDNQLRRELAFKILHAHLNTSAPAVRRFQDEARILGQLQHPGVVPVHEVGTLLDGRPYFAMKLVRGRTLSELPRQRAQGDVPRVLKIFEQICQTLAYAHAHQVIHRDLKPANIMVGAFGEVQVMDWGLAKVLTNEGATLEEAVEDDPLATITQMGSAATGAADTHTQAGSVLGTLGYMPPEQARGQIAQIDRRSDVFGLGSLLCEVLTGAPPYAAKKSRGAARPGHGRRPGAGAGAAPTVLLGRRPPGAGPALPRSSAGRSLRSRGRSCAVHDALFERCRGAGASGGSGTGPRGNAGAGGA